MIDLIESLRGPPSILGKQILSPLWLGVLEVQTESMGIIVLLSKTYGLNVESDLILPARLGCKILYALRLLREAFLRDSRPVV